MKRTLNYLWPISASETDDESPEEPDEQDEPTGVAYESADPPMKTVTETKEKKYTYHEAIVHYPNGDTDEISFDFMKRKDDEVLIGDYAGYSKNRDSFSPSGFKSEVTDSFPIQNHRRIETINREKRTMEYEVSKKVPKPAVGHP